MGITRGLGRQHEAAGGAGPVLLPRLGGTRGCTLPGPSSPTVPPGPPLGGTRTCIPPRPAPTALHLEAVSALRPAHSSRARGHKASEEPGLRHLPAATEARATFPNAGARRGQTGAPVCRQLWPGTGGWGAASEPHPVTQLARSTPSPSACLVWMAQRAPEPGHSPPRSPGPFPAPREGRNATGPPLAGRRGPVRRPLQIPALPRNTGAGAGRASLPGRLGRRLWSPVRVSRRQCQGPLGERGHSWAPAPRPSRSPADARPSTAVTPEGTPRTWAGAGADGREQRGQSCPGRTCLLSSLG